METILSDLALEHFENFHVDVFSLEDSVAASIDGESMLIQNIVIFENVFSNVKITTFNLFLNHCDIPHECLGFDEWIVFRVRFKIGEKRKEAISSEYSHDIVLWGQHEL